MLVHGFSLTFEFNFFFILSSCKARIASRDNKVPDMQLVPDSLHKHIAAFAGTLKIK